MDSEAQADAKVLGRRSLTREHEAWLKPSLHSHLLNTSYGSGALTHCGMMDLQEQVNEHLATTYSDGVGMDK